jgi:microcin C transport system ATP-binding protein
LENVLEYREHRLRSIRGKRIGYIFQEPSTSFNPLFTIEAHLHEAHQVATGQRKRDHSAISRALEEVGIPADSEHLKAWPGSFSGGMLQRAAIACALLAKPDLLIADEPTTALDTTTQKRIMNLIGRLNKDHGMAVLFISHDLGLLKECSTRLMVMRKGEIVETGETTELIQNPKHEYTRHLLEKAPKLRLK